MRHLHWAVWAAVAACVSTTQAAVFSDNFESGTLADNGWTTTSGNWTISTASGKKYLANTIKAAGSVGQDISHSFSTVTNSWSVSFDYDWNYGGSLSTGNGSYGYAISVLMLSSDGNGYAVTVHQGTSDNANNQNRLIEIYKVTDGAIAATSLAGGTGYNRIGWKSTDATHPAQSAPRFTSVELTWDQATGLLSAWYYVDGVRTLSASIADTSYTSFEQITILAKGWTSTEAPLLDNITVQTIPEAASIGFLSLGALTLLRRR